MKLTVDRFQISEFARTVYAVTVPAGTKFEDILDEAFWSHVSAKMRPRDRIEVTTEDCTWFAELFVTASSANWAKVSVLRFVELSEAPQHKADVKETSAPSGYEVAWSGPKDRFRVTRLSDKALMKNGFTTKAEATAWLAEHETNLMV